MSRKNKKESFLTNAFGDIREEIVRSVSAVFFVAIAIFLSLSAFHMGGVAGNIVFSLFRNLLGIGYYLLPILLLMLAVAFLRSLHKEVGWTQLTSGLVFFISGLGTLDLIFKDGGTVGHIISRPLNRFFDFYVTLIFLLALVVISLLVMFDVELSFSWWKKLTGREKDKAIEKDIVIPAIEHTVSDDIETDDVEVEPKVYEAKKARVGDFIINPRRLGSTYVPPPLSLLEGDRGKPGVGDIKANANIIKRTLQNFGIIVEMDEISIGPSVTRYALKPAEGVKLSRIVGLQNDLSLALAAHPIRIEAPIPGKSLVGIEIPNTTKTTVGLGTLLSDEEFQKSDKPLMFALGRGVSGISHFANLAKMPHMLIAGATGSGKSVTIHAIITSLLYRNSPENLKFIMIDPKRVELTLYNKIPHLLTPVVTDAKKAILALKWIAREMDRRYDVLEAESVRDIQSYHKNILEPELKKIADKKISEGDKIPETMPYIVIIIDELADIMQTYPRELESAIVRLAQMSRAVGIHLILSTQRPSVNVITGLIKANIPARIALQVASQIDSRTILDAGGAEKLLGAGDMLYLSGDMSKPNRIQSSFIGETEVKKVVKYLSDTYKDELPSEINLTDTNGKSNIFEASIEDEDGGDDDELYEEAREIVMSAGKASTSYLQRKLRVGYARAARLIDMLEERGVVSGGSGAKPREVIDQASDSQSTDNAQNP
ncbi:DNA translocase FtsK [Candidatus Parcubacteria bacterium]|nr:DNA translocase FtsK [Candidatus Parcubacteria bacterium]